MSINPYFMFATGIENSYPTIRNGSDRVDEIVDRRQVDRKSTRLHFQSLMRTSYAVFCLKKKKAQSHFLEKDRSRKRPHLTSKLQSTPSIPYTQSKTYHEMPTQ